MSNFDDWRDLFQKVGDHFLHPKSWGDCSYPVSIEEMYQAFKERMRVERMLPENEDRWREEFEDRFGAQYPLDKRGEQYRVWTTECLWRGFTAGIAVGMSRAAAICEDHEYAEHAGEYITAEIPKCNSDPK